MWHDLTVEHAESVRDLYAAALGWSFSTVNMGDYDDFVLASPQGDNVGVCHARGDNASIPAAWILYFAVENLEHSLSEWQSRGGTIVNGPRTMGESKFAIVRDTAGAHCAFFQAG